MAKDRDNAGEDAASRSKAGEKGQRFSIVNPDEAGARVVEEETPRAARPAATEGMEAFSIEWFDEERPPQAGHIFAEAPPEPPPQPFEIVHEQDREDSAKKKPVKPAPVVVAPPPPPLPPVDWSQPLPALWVRVWWGFLPLTLLVLGYMSVVFTQEGVGFAWDESYYYEPALKAADWLTELLRGGKPTDAASIEEFWEERHEHPSIQKFLSGVSLRIFPDEARSLEAMRLPMAILFGMTLSLIYMVGRRAFGPLSGLAAAVLYATLPRIFGHAHFATMETVLLFMMMLTLFCFLRGLDSAFWAAMTGVSLGLLLATKINAFFLPVPLVLWAHLYARRRYVNNLFAMLTLGPVVWMLAWPWLWNDTAQRILEYLFFHTVHQKTSVYFMGTIFGGPGAEATAPWFYPLVMIGVTTPLAHLLLMLVGVGRTLVHPHRRPYGTLFLMCAAVMLGVACMPSTPKYDGLRLFLPAFPFLALLGGSGFVSIVTRGARGRGRGGRGPPARGGRGPRGAARGRVALRRRAARVAIARYRPFWLSYYNPLVGGLAGAEKNFEVTYWGETLNKETLHALNALPDGARVKPLALHELNFQLLQRWGLLKPTLKIGGNPPVFDYHIIQMRRGFYGRPERALAETNIFPRVFVLRKMGVPLLGIYETGERYERVWPAMEKPIKKMF